ncbi:MAG: VOC family protein [Phycisphaerae bacterium]
MSEIRGIVETSLYFADLPRAIEFYRSALGLIPNSHDERMASYCIAPGQMLLFFRRGGTPHDMVCDAGTIPAHDGIGPTHLGLAIAEPDFDEWNSRLTAAGVTIVSEMRWSRGGRSVYFHDPERNLVELITPGIWPVY